MNKQELIDYCNAIKENKSQIINCIDVNGIIKKIEQLDEPQKVVVPQFVADYIDISKFYVRTLHYALENSPEKVNLWLCENEINRQNTFARAWLDGYEIEKEKLFKVRLKGTSQYLCNDDTGLHFQHGFKTDFTKEYLEKANFGWVFDCPGIEVEEVE